MLKVLITHYNRPEKLRRLVESLSVLGAEIIVSDDCSKAEVVQTIKTLGVRIVEAPRNQGLACSINRGLRACSGEYVLYVQDDMVPKIELSAKLPLLLELLDSGLDMVRLTTNPHFPKLKPIADGIFEIPRFSWKNVLCNHMRYSDHPFIARRDFFDRYGYYLEQTSCLYGENEYMVRIMHSKARIGIAQPALFFHKDGGQSVRDDATVGLVRTGYSKLAHDHLRAMRFLLEYAAYNETRRGLKTFKNLRRGGPHDLS